MGVAWLVGTVALALLTSAGQCTVEVLTVPSQHMHTPHKRKCLPSRSLKNVHHSISRKCVCMCVFVCVIDEKPQNNRWPVRSHTHLDGAIPVHAITLYLQPLTSLPNERMYLTANAAVVKRNKRTL